MYFLDKDYKLSSNIFTVDYSYSISAFFLSNIFCCSPLYLGFYFFEDYFYFIVFFYYSYLVSLATVSTSFLYS